MSVTMEIRTLSQDALEYSLNIISKVEELINVKKNRKYGEDFQTRCRSLPELINDVGLLPVLTYVYAKATENVYEKVVKFMEGGMRAEEIDNDTDKVGYALFLYAVIKWLINKGLLQCKSPEKISDELKELASASAMKITIIMNVLRPMYIVLKHLVDAKYK